MLRCHATTLLQRQEKLKYITDHVLQVPVELRLLEAVSQLGTGGPRVGSLRLPLTYAMGAAPRHMRASGDSGVLQWQWLARVIALK